MSYNRSHPHRAAGDRATADFLEAIHELLATNDVKKAELARRIDMTYNGIKATLLRGGRSTSLRLVAEMASALGYSFEFRFVPIEALDTHRPPLRADCPVCREPNLKVSERGRLQSHGTSKTAPRCRASNMQIWTEPEPEREVS